MFIVQYYIYIYIYSRIHIDIHIYKYIYLSHPQYTKSPRSCSPSSFTYSKILYMDVFLYHSITVNTVFDAAQLMLPPHLLSLSMQVMPTQDRSSAPRNNCDQSDISTKLRHRSRSSLSGATVCSSHTYWRLCATSKIVYSSFQTWNTVYILLK